MNSANHEFSAQLLAAQDRERWLACLFAPADRRLHLHALYGFAHEIARVRDVVSEPQLGEIRLQWWREVLEGARDGEARLNPVSAALLETMAVMHLPAAPLIDLIEARRFDLYNDPMPDLNTLEGYCGETQSAPMRLAAAILLKDNPEPPDDNLLADACGHAGVALGIVEMLRALPRHAARGQCYVPKDVLARHGAVVEAMANGLVTQPGLAALGELRAVALGHGQKARAAIARLPQAVRPAFVLLAAVPLYLRRMEKLRDPFREPAAVALWRRQWAMWRF